MSAFDSTIRLRQANQPEFSGYTVQVIQNYLSGNPPLPSTGVLSGVFYPLVTNPSGFVTSSQTGVFKTQTDLNSLYTQTLYYVGQNYYPNTNPSGYITGVDFSGGNFSGNLSGVVYTTGDQTISGIKTFINQSNFSGAVNVKNLTQITDILGLAGSISVGNASNNSKLLLTFDGTYDPSIYAIDDSYNYYPLNLKGSEIFLNQFDGGNVGINTPSLFYALDVNGTIGNSNGNLIIGSTNNPSPNGNGIQIIAGQAQSYPATQEGGGILINAGNDLNAGNGPGSITLNAGDANAFNGGDVNLNAGDSSDDYFEARIGGNVILTAGSAPSGNGSIQLLNGNVGIKTSSPNYTLDVNGSGNFRSGLYVSGIAVLTGVPTVTVTNAVYTTGNQSISGIKTFLTGIVVNGSLIQGNGNIASGLYSHAEGSATIASGQYSHAEGAQTITKGPYSHAEGVYSIASGYGSHAEGLTTISSGGYSHAEGWLAISSGDYSHAEGYGTFSVGLASHAEGSSNYARGATSHAEGGGTTAFGQSSHSEGTYTYASGISSHAEGNNTFSIGQNSHSEGISTNANGQASHAEGDSTIADGYVSHAEGVSTIANGTSSHAEGGYSIAYGEESHAEGDANQAIGFASHAEGTLTYANGENSHAEGNSTYANGLNSHSEGYLTYAYKDDSHSEGFVTIASGLYSHSEGLYTVTVGAGSHAEGAWTIASGDYQHVGGKYNLPNLTSLLIIGNGTSTGARSNILTIESGGLNVYGSGNFTGGLYINGVAVSTGASSSSAAGVSQLNTLTGNLSIVGVSGVSVYTSGASGIIISGNFNTGSFVTTGQTGNFVTTSQTGNANTLGGQSGSYYLNLANQTGSLAGTGAFITSGQTGVFVTTGQTGSFITSGQTGVFVTTGQTGVFATSTNLISTGSNLQGQITNLSGTLTGNYATSGFGASTYATITNLASTGSTLQGQITSLSGTLTGNYATSGFGASTYATITNLGLTGAQITSLSGTLTGNYVLTTTATGISGALTTSIASTGSNLQGQINGLSGKVIFTTGTQTISGVGINSILSVLAPSGLTGDYYNALDSGRNSVFRVGPITNGTRLALFPSGNPTAWGKLSIEPDPAYAAGWATFLGVSTNGNGGRIYLCGLDTAGAPIQGFTALNLSYVKTVESFPSKLSMQANDNGLGYNSASVSAIAGGIGDLVLAVGSAGGFITNAQINTNNTASLSFKSYNNTGQQYVAQHPEAYTFDTAYNVPSLGGLQHTRWKVSGSNIMSLNPSGRLGIRTDSPNYQLEVIGSGNFSSGLYVSGFSVLTGEPFAISLSGLFSTGNQTGTLAISGTKTFTGVVNFNSATFVNRPTVNGTGVLLSGEASSATVSNVVYTTGNSTQTISGSLTVTGHFSANTKSFLINHPTQVGRKLQYGSLESPYHGVRLTGKGKIKNGICQVELPEYIKGLVHQEEVNIQITNINHDKILYVKWIDINNNNFIIGCNNDFNNNEYEFYWSFTAVRKDVEYLKVEY